MKKTLTRIKNTIFDIRFTPVILLLLCLLSYGIFIPSTGFFIDDWYIMWFKHFFGALQFPAYFSVDRPFMGYFYTISSYLLLGSESPVVWALFAIVLRWLSSLALWGMLNTLWPKAAQQNRAVVLLAAVFPGFTQHWIVVIYSYFYTCLAFFFLSVTLMIKAIREPKRFWIYYPISLLLGFYSMTSEFFFGLELIRPVILYIELKKNGQSIGKQILSIIKYWGAFFVYFIGFAIWRFFFFESVNHSIAITNSLLANPVNTLLSTVRNLYQSIVNATINSWTNPFNLSNYPGKGFVSVLIPIIVFFVFLCLFIWLTLASKQKGAEKEKDESIWRGEALLLSLSSLLFAGIPFLAAGLSIDYLGFNNRFLLAFLFGSCLLIVLIFDSLSSWIRKGIFIVALLVSVSIGYQISNANFYKNVWLQEEQIYWQLNWRIPGLQPGTTLFTYSLPANGDLIGGHALTAQINWTYSDEIVNRQVNYQFIILDSGQRSSIKSLLKDVPIDIDFRTYQFHGNTSNSIYISIINPGCIRIFDPNLTPAETIIPDFANQISHTDIESSSNLTDLSLILNDGVSQNHPPLQILGSEIPHTWCYYFEKAELARQYGEYAKVLSLLGEATVNGYSPEVDNEWYPFVDAYARSGDWKNAELITGKLIAKNDPTIRLGLCHIWNKLSDDFTDPASINITSKMMNSTLNCSNK
jgi:hypothetical protein